MIHVQIDGVQSPINAPINVSLEPFGPDPLNNLQQEYTVGLALVKIVDITGEFNNGSFQNFGNLHYIRNVSVLGQTIGLGWNLAATMTVANADKLLYPGEEWVLQNVLASVWAIADAAAGKIRLWSGRVRGAG